MFKFLFFLFVFFALLSFCSFFSFDQFCHLSFCHFVILSFCHFVILSFVNIDICSSMQSKHLKGGCSLERFWSFYLFIFYKDKKIKINIQRAFVLLKDSGPFYFSSAAAPFKTNLKFLRTPGTGGCDALPA